MGDGVFFERLNLAENRLHHSFQHVKISQFSMFVRLSVTLFLPYLISQKVSQETQLHQYAQICVQSNEKKKFWVTIYRRLVMAYVNITVFKPFFPVLFIPFFVKRKIGHPPFYRHFTPVSLGVK